MHVPVEVKGLLPSSYILAGKEGPADPPLGHVCFPGEQDLGSVLHLHGQKNICITSGRGDAVL